jgi:hypothetical protein
MLQSIPHLRENPNKKRISYGQQGLLSKAFELHTRSRRDLRAKPNWLFCPVRLWFVIFLQLVICIKQKHKRGIIYENFFMILVTLMSVQVLGSSVNTACNATSSPNVNYFVYRDFCPLTNSIGTVSVPGSAPTPAATPAPTTNPPPPQGSTADPNANRTTKKLYSWWQGLISQTSNKVIQAALVNYRNCAAGGCPGYEAQLTAAGGNLSMAAIGGGYCNGFIGTGAYCVFGPNSDANVYAKQYWAAGGLVSISMHMNNPFNNYDNHSETCAGYPNCTGHPGSVTDNYCVSDSSIAAMVTPGGTYNCGGGNLNVNANWNTELDQIAKSLLDLQTSGVTVIWRPMAEQNASWFWYGKVSGAVYQNLWKYMFNYFTNVRGVHNLLWDFSVNSGHGNPENTYPGDGYVDVVGEDLYSGVGPNDSFSWYSDFTTNHPTKPYGLDEVGPTTVANSYNYSNLIQAVHNRNPKTTWIMQWWNDGNYSIVNQLGGSVFMSDPWSITLKDVPAH